MKIRIYFFENDVKQFLQQESMLLQFEKIFTNTPTVKELLKKRSIKCQTINEYFPFGNKKTIKNNEKSMKKLKKYEKIFNETTYKGVKLFESFEPRILNEIIFLNRIKEILEQEQNKSIAFIFRDNSILYFSLNEWLRNNFENSEIEIMKIIGNGVERITDYKIEKSSILKNKNFSHNIKKRAIMKLKSKITIKSNGKNFDRIKKKIEKIENGSCLFFFNPGTDYVLSSIFPVIQEFKNKEPYGIIVFDLETSRILEKNQIHFIDLSEEFQNVIGNLKNNNEYIIILEKIKNLCKIHKIEEIYFKNKFNPMIDLFLSIVGIVDITKIILEQINPKSVIVCFDGNMYGNSVVSTSKKQKIQTYCIWPFLIPKDPIRATFKAEKICVYGLHGMDSLKFLGYDEKNIFLTGNPNYDYIKTIDIKYEREKFKNKKIENQKIIVLGFGKWDSGDAIWMPKFINFCSKHGFFVIIKVKPIYKVMLQDHHKFMVKSINEQCKKSNFYITIDDEPKSVISNADLVITGSSNFGIEASMYGIPVISANFESKSNEEANELFHPEYMNHVKKYEDLEKKVLEIFNRKTDKEILKKPNMEMTNQYNIFNDGHASNRIFRLISGKNNEK